MDAVLRQLVWARANGICEYCRMVVGFDPSPFCIDHIIAQQHHGPTVETNLALSCFSCNSHKGPNLTGIDLASGKLTELFNPRTLDWEHHFVWKGPVLVGLTAIGRVTMDVLNINDTERVEHRKLLIKEEVFPPRSP